MSENKNSFECNTICWGIAAAVGFVSMVMLWLLSEFTILQAIFTGGLIGFLLGVILSLFVCRGQKSATDLAAAEKPAQLYAREAAEQKAERESRAPVKAPTAASGSAGAAPASAAAGGESSGGAEAAAGGDSAGGVAAGGDSAGDAAAASASAAPAASAAASTGAANTTRSSFASSGVEPSAPLAGEAELASRKGSWKYDGGDDGAATSTAKSAPAVEAAAPAATSEPAAAEPAKAASATPAAASSSSSLEGASSDGDSPLLFAAPPSDGVDDLKLISGVGPKLEGTLNEMGIYRFAQVAVWGPKDIAWVDDRLRFKGRIERDDWMSQAKILADGGETEFSKRKK